MSLLLWLPRRGKLGQLLPLDSGRPVVLLHGTLGSPGNFAKLAEALTTAGRPVFAPEFGKRGTGDIHASVAEVAALIDAHLPPDAKFDIVGHSLGGFIGLHVAHLPQFAGRVGTLVGLGAAFRGAPNAKVGRFRRQLYRVVVGPAFAQLLDDFEAELPDGVRVVSIYSDADTVVSNSASMLGELVEVKGVHHAWIPDEVDAVLEALGVDKADVDKQPQGQPTELEP